MYTQCPDCEIAFSVTAEVLKQAAGRVRCGGCGNAFNALDFLSERQPQTTDIDELRFDDNTPLPDDFDADEKSSDQPPVANEPEAVDSNATAVEAPPEISLGEPDEWQDILGEFDELAAVIAKPANVKDTDEPLDMDSQFALQAEAMGIDLSGTHEIIDRNPQLDLIEVPQDPIAENHAIENELAGIDAEHPPIKHYVPPMTEEEQTVNMMIDQDLMAVAMEDDDGFASTIAMDDANAEDLISAEDDAGSSSQMPGFETIIMEGESFRSAHDNEKRAKDAAEAAELASLARTDEADVAARSRRKNHGITAGVVVLILLLLIQVVHQSRAALATTPAFSEILSPIYRALGQPLQPAWDISGWRFETTRSSTQITDEGEQLTIYSRLGNKSGDPLPYPLIGISLTDRFEEVIGSRVLDPADYLPFDLDPRKLVVPGDTFDAVISIRSPSDEATGYKLNVCYRLSNGLLRCAIEDFM